LPGCGIVAVKGLGGYHLACDATDEAAVVRLRERKRRWAKPLAVMVANLPAARRIGRVTAAHERLLTGPERPIVLVDQVQAAAVAPAVCAGIRQVGLLLPYTGLHHLLLPYTGLHHLLLADFGRPIVLTSGNRSDEPIAVDDAEASTRLGDIADGFLAHDRRIRSRYEDPVVTIVDGAPALLRRGRGHAPAPLRLPVPATLRAPTRGGLASTLNEIAAAAGVGIDLDETTIPVDDQVRAACDLLGLDPLHVANEGVCVAFIPAAQADAALAAMRRHPEGAHTVAIGRAVPDHPGRVTMRTGIGAQRVVDPLIGEQLPRIC
jgi:tRNA A37 threonylcarbamoyladenosine synthetase subunit TsaC/SUA5/YrdC